MKTIEFYKTKNTLERINSRLEKVEDQISELEDKVEKNTHSEQQLEKKERKRKSRRV